MKNLPITKDSFAQFRELVQTKEEQTLYPQAAFSKNHSRYFEKEDDHRLPYKRDVDRIVHSKAYARYADKTQVVYLVDNDHITHRGLHVQLVSNFARGIAEILCLNLDLVEAISLGHDVGHPPFGHEGEGYLSELSHEYGNGYFAHSMQSCRLFTEIEPLNLGFAVYDGFLCHDGGMRDFKLTPLFKKDWKDHFEECAKKREDPDANFTPATLEGCLVKLCDTISYLGKDLEDALTLGIITLEQIPKTPLGYSNREILSHLARDIIQTSYNQDYIALSEESYQALKVLRRFNFEQIYIYPKLKVESPKIKYCYRLLFEWLLQDLEKKGGYSYIWKQFLHNKPQRYLDQSSDIQKVIDFIAGMTDNFFIRTLETLIMPKRIHL